MDYVGVEAGRLRDGVVVDGRSLGSGAEATKETTHGSLNRCGTLGEEYVQRENGGALQLLI